MSRFDTEDTCYYKENIFNIEDLYLFRAILRFYLSESVESETLIVEAMKDF